jgi:hypothetical protein
MKVDISRDTFRSQRHYSSVRLEQGRIQVDADWNEQVAINLHHTRTTARDTIGRTGTPKQEPGFQVVLAPGGADLLVTPGKFYVDGILCELEAPSAPLLSYGPAARQAAVPRWVARSLAKDLWVEASVAGQAPIDTRITAVDTTTGVVTFTDEVKALGAGAQLRVLATYGTQPDLEVTLPSPLFAIGSALIYLDAWERSVTALDDPDIREVALGGADTSTRTRIVWQLKVLPLTGAGPFSCASALPEFDKVTTAPTGRLSARAKRDVTTDNPCVVPASSGFRRLENQLYRVEIHAPGSLTDGKATFKWSRDNAAVVARITGQVGTVLTLAAAPRDQALGFSSGDWVEVTDDVSELAGIPGTLIRLSKAEGKQLTLDTSTGTLDLTRYPANPKVRRWDSAGALAVKSNPAVDDGFLRLEDGVQVKFEDGTYSSSDYWVVPARTITGDVEWPRDAGGPVPQLRKGPLHHFARLAIATTALQGSTAVTTLADCRQLFPPLNDITADDVSLDSDCDLLINARTVHQALDVLCHERSLTFHNQHLHGWGIVCGLQVQCGPDTAKDGAVIHDVVTVKNGYAIDSRGRDIVVETSDAQANPIGDQLHVLDMLRSTKLLIDPKDPTKLVDGSISLSIQQGATAQDRYRIELYDPGSNTWASAFQSTFWWDVWQDCIVPLQVAFHDEFIGQDDQTWEHVISFINVLSQLLFPQNGPHVYISPKENQILHDFYDKLRGLLQSKTFCAMFDGRAFPTYDSIFRTPTPDPRPSTIFGKVLQGLSLPSRMRITPNGALAVMVSGKVVAANQSSIINLFDVEYRVPTTDAKGNPVFESSDVAKEKLLGSTAFPTSGATVTDVAFSPDAKTMYAIAILNQNDSLFCVADITDPANVKWGQVTTLCDQPLVTLKLSPLDPKKLCATARGFGLFTFDTSGLKPAQPLVASFLATGHLEVATIGTGDQRKAYAFCTVYAAGSSPPNYVHVRRIDLSNAAAVFEYALPASNPQGVDDICVGTTPDGRIAKLFVVANPTGAQTSKQLVRFDAAAAPTASVPPPEATIDLGFTQPNGTQGSADNTSYRLAYNDLTQRVMIASFDAFLIKLLPLTAAVLDPVTHPAQLWPAAIAYNPSAVFTSVDGKTRLTGGVYVLNALSGTINNIPAAYLGQNPPAVNLAALATYHNGVLEAFIDLFGRFAQYLKDCVCDHFLVQCPDDTLKTLYLARIDIQNQQVFNICNFSRRRYVHSFPAVEHWLSIVPVLPVVRKLIGDACCQIIQQFFSTVNAPDATTRSDVVSSSSAWNGLQSVQALDLANLLSTQVLGKLGLAGSFLKTLLSGATSTPPAPPAPATGKASLTDVANQSSANATRLLTDKKVTVLSKEVATSGTQLTDALAAPAVLDPGSNVVLVTDTRDRVVGYRVVKPAPEANLSSGNTVLVAELAKRDAAITQLGTQLQAVQKDHAAALATRDKQIADLGTKMDTLMARTPAPK